MCEDEREVVQKKTFTKWCNSHLQVAAMHMDDLFLDLRDGKVLLKLLEILSGERLVRSFLSILSRFLGLSIFLFISLCLGFN